MQERRNSIANALELRLSCTNPSIYRPAVSRRWRINHSGVYEATDQNQVMSMVVLYEFEQSEAATRSTWHINKSCNPNWTCFCYLDQNQVLSMIILYEFEQREAATRSTWHINESCNLVTGRILATWTCSLYRPAVCRCWEALVWIFKGCRTWNQYQVINFVCTLVQKVIGIFAESNYDIYFQYTYCFEI